MQAACTKYILVAECTMYPRCVSVCVFVFSISMIVQHIHYSWFYASTGRTTISIRGLFVVIFCVFSFEIREIQGAPEYLLTILFTSLIPSGHRISFGSSFLSLSISQFRLNPLVKFVHSIEVIIIRVSRKLSKYYENKILFNEDFSMFTDLTLIYGVFFFFSFLSLSFLA